MNLHGKKILPECFLSAMLLQSSLYINPALAEDDKTTQETQSVPEIVVTADKLIIPTMQASETVYTGSEITAKGIEIQGPRASTSVSNALNLLPGINVESPDSNGLAAEMSNVRVRGVRGSLGALTVEGVPNYGGNAIGPRDYLYDLENMQGLSVYKGAVPGDIGTGIGSRGGAMNLKPDWPHEDLGFDDTREGVATYCQGALFTAMLSASLEF